MKKLVLAILVMSPILSSMCLADDLVDDPNYKAKCAMCHGAAAEGKEKMKTPPMKEKAGKPVAELTKQIEDGARAELGPHLRYMAHGSVMRRREHEAEPAFGNAARDRLWRGLDIHAELFEHVG